MPDLKAHSIAILHRIRGLFDIRYFFSPNAIIPVMVINDKYYTPASTANGTITTVTDVATIMTSRDDRNTYIHSATIAVQRVGLGSLPNNAIINATQNGVTIALLRINLDAGQGVPEGGAHTITFPKPIIIDRNTAVTINLDDDAAVTDQYTGLISFSEEDAQEAHF